MMIPAPRELPRRPQRGDARDLAPQLPRGDIRWVLQADTASVFRDRKRVEAQWVTIDFFDGERRVSKRDLRSGGAAAEHRRPEARGHVVVVSDDGATLKTEVLFWDHERARIHTDEPVEITRGRCADGHRARSGPRVWIASI